ncbi:MAG: hypothetical protein JWP24_2762, partial [Marmoricola sp.]|nr:hypothetical protein [Marmoricola sp.]
MPPDVGDEQGWTHQTPVGTADERGQVAGLRTRPTKGGRAGHLYATVGFVKFSRL